MKYNSTIRFGHYWFGPLYYVLLHSSKAIGKETAPMTRRPGRASPDPGFGPQIESSSGDAGVYWLLGISVYKNRRGMPRNREGTNLYSMHMQADICTTKQKEDVFHGRKPGQGRHKHAIPLIQLLYRKLCVLELAWNRISVKGQKRRPPSWNVSRVIVEKGHENRISVEKVRCMPQLHI